MQKDFYKYPKQFETSSYVMERKTNGWVVIYQVKEKETKQNLGSIEIDESKRVKERAGWRKINQFVETRGICISYTTSEVDQFQKVEEEVSQYLKEFFKM